MHSPTLCEDFPLPLFRFIDAFSHFVWRFLVRVWIPVLGPAVETWWVKQMHVLLCYLCVFVVWQQLCAGHIMLCASLVIRHKCHGEQHITQSRTQTLVCSYCAFNMRSKKFEKALGTRLHITIPRKSNKHQYIILSWHVISVVFDFGRRLFIYLFIYFSFFCFN